MQGSDDGDDDVRKRLGPIISRLTASIAKIHRLEDSIQQRRIVAKDDSHQPEERSSRRMLNENMAVVRNKMLRLKTMEQELSDLEDRRVHLQMHCQQQIAWKAVIKAQNAETTTTTTTTICPALQIANETTSVAAEDVLSQQAKSVEMADYVKRIEKQLKEANESRARLETRLEKQDCMLRGHAAKCKSLEMKVEVLTKRYDHLTIALDAQEKRNSLLERELMETTPLHYGHPLKKVDYSGISESLDLTAPLDVSWAESTIANETSFVENEYSNSADE